MADADEASLNAGDELLYLYMCKANKTLSLNIPELSESLLGRIPLIGPCWGDGFGGCAGEGVFHEA